MEPFPQSRVWGAEHDEVPDKTGLAEDWVRAEQAELGVGQVTERAVDLAEYLDVFLGRAVHVRRTAYMGGKEVVAHAEEFGLNVESSFDAKRRLDRFGRLEEDDIPSAHEFSHHRGLARAARTRDSNDHVTVGSTCSLARQGGTGAH